MINLFFIIGLCCSWSSPVAHASLPRWQELKSGCEASLRGLSAVNDLVCWTSGSDGTVLITVDGGKNWKNCSPRGYENLQFRDIHAFDQNRALILSAGLPAVILKTADGGKSWKEVYHNENPGIFFDAMDFWDEQKGLAFSDAPDRKPFIIKTTNGGESWKQIDPAKLPEIALHQGGFAASGTCLKTFGSRNVVIGLGGSEATILLSHDSGENWQKTNAPLDSGNYASGIFSFAFRDSAYGFCAGGNYRADSLTKRNLAITRDGGKTWSLFNGYGLNQKYLSCIIHCNQTVWLAVSRFGSYITFDDGKLWKSLGEGFYSISHGKNTHRIWASGPKGKVSFIKIAD